MPAGFLFCFCTELLRCGRTWFSVHSFLFLQMLVVSNSARSHLIISHHQCWEGDGQNRLSLNQPANIFTNRCWCDRTASPAWRRTCGCPTQSDKGRTAQSERGSAVLPNQIEGGPSYPQREGGPSYPIREREGCPTQSEIVRSASPNQREGRLPNPIRVWEGHPTQSEKGRAAQPDQREAGLSYPIRERQGCSPQSQSERGGAVLPNQREGGAILPNQREGVPSYPIRERGAVLPNQREGWPSYPIRERGVIVLSWTCGNDCGIIRVCFARPGGSGAVCWISLLKHCWPDWQVCGSGSVEKLLGHMLVADMLNPPH